jgi:Uma2 family endonuclease
MSQLQTPILTDTWVPMPWDNYAKLIEQPDYAKAKGYYYQEHARIEMLPISHDHAADDGAITLVVNLFCIVKQIPFKVLPNCSYQAAQTECQPDVSFYFRAQANAVPYNTSTINLDRYPAPDLVIEISKTTLLDDLGAKRSLYEAIGVAEYWVVNVGQGQVIAYAITQQGSYRIERSQVLPDLPISLLTETLQRSRQTDQSQIGTWLIRQFQP